MYIYEIYEYFENYVNKSYNSLMDWRPQII